MAGLLVLAAALGIDAGTSLTVVGYFGLAPLIAAVAGPPTTTAALGSLALFGAVLSGTWDHRFGSSQHWALIMLAAVESALAVFMSHYRMRRESELRQVRAVAEVAQRALLPAVPAELDGVRFAARYLSAAQEASVGGDLYEVVATPHTIRVIIGDVRGKGLPAVRLATVVLGAFREAAVTWLDPEQVATACARAVSREADPEDFVTALLVDIHADGRLSLCSAGHHPPVLLTADGAEALPVSSPSSPLGLADRFTVTSARWDVGDRLLLFTDGLIEARDPDGGFFPLDGHVDALRGGTPDEALDRLTARLSAHAGGNLRDDLALLLVERSPPPAGRVAGAVRREATAVRTGADEAFAAVSAATAESALRQRGETAG
jgi:serine phosphatase RsbU (regulator of sigma subunit)